MIREENEKAMRESKFVTNSRVSSSENNENAEPTSKPVRLVVDPEHLVHAYGTVAKGMRLPERKVKGLPTKGSGAITDAQAAAAVARVHRWKQVNAAVGGMVYRDAACGTDNLFNNEPATASQLFERGIGPYANRQFATTQTGGAGDVRDFETQTEAADRRSVEAQCPEDMGLSREQLEAMSADESTSAAAMRKKKAANLAMKWARATGDLQHSKDRRLAAFISRAGVMADTLLRERRLVSGTADLMRHAGQLKRHATPGQPGSLTQAYVALEDSDLTGGRAVTSSAFAPGARGASLLLVAYGPSDARAHGLAGHGLLLVWDLSAPVATPLHAMVLEGTPTCVAWGPRVGHHLVVCGTEEGALCAWDLREPEEMHRAGGVDGEAAANEEPAPDIMRGRPFRRPAYCTEAFAVEFPEDAGGIVSVGVAVDTSSSQGRDGDRGEDARSGTGGGGGEFHLIACDCWGNVSTYLMSELSKREALDVALTDMGLRFGSRVRLLKAGTNIPYGGAGAAAWREGSVEGVMVGGGGSSGGSRAKARARDMMVQNRVGSAAEFFVATETGAVKRGARYGVSPPPRTFAACDPLDAGVKAAHPPFAAAVSLSVNPFFPDVFLVVHEGGSAGMYSTASSLALRRWDAITPGDAVAVRWSLARPTLFFVLDDRCFVYAIDLLSSDLEAPVHVEQFGKKERIVSMEVASTANAASAQKGQHLLSLAYDDGRTDVHLLADDFATCSPEDMEKARAVLNPARGVDSLADQLKGVM